MNKHLLMKHSLYFFMALFLSLFTYSCNDGDILATTAEVKPDIETVNELIDGLNETFNYSQSSTPSSENGRTKIINLDNFFISQINSKGLSVAKSDSYGEVGEHSKIYNEFVSKIANGDSYDSKKDFIHELRMLGSEINASSMSLAEKQILINKVAFMDAFVDWSETIGNRSSHLRPTTEDKDKKKDEGWWESWGKCAAGTVGSALGGAATGAVGPAAGCTLVLPIIGTVACGTVGAVVGGVSGALVGSATFCDSE